MGHFFQGSTVAPTCNSEMQIEMRDGTAEHFPVGRPVERHRVDGAPLDVGVEDPLPGVVEGQPDGVLHKVSGNTISDQQFSPLTGEICWQWSVDYNKSSKCIVQWHGTNSHAL